MKEERKLINTTDFIELVQEKIKNKEYVISNLRVDHAPSTEKRAKPETFNLLDVFKPLTVKNQRINNGNKKVVCKPITFKNITFLLNDISLGEENSNFSASLIFENCIIEELLFGRMGSKINFSFSKKTVIQFVHFKSWLNGNVQFNDVTINHIDCNGVNLNDKLSFYGTQFGVPVKQATLGTSAPYPDPSDAPVRCYSHFKNTRFSKLTFFNCKFYVAPDFLGSELNHQTIFSQCYFFDMRQDAIANYRLLRSEMQRLGNERETIMFSSLELESSHLYEFENKNITPSDKCEKYISILYRHFNDYGKDVFKPILWLVLLLIVFWELYFFGDLLEVNIESIKKAPNWIQQSLLSDNGYRVSFYGSLSESAINSLGPIGYFVEENHIQSHNLIGEITILLQRVFSSLMWFLWILQIRRRFKLS